jgi:hypothetical protein
MSTVTPINRDALAHYVTAATDYFPDILEVAGVQIKCSVTDSVLDKEETETGYMPSVDAIVTILNERLDGLCLTFDTRCVLRGKPVRILNITPSADSRTTQYAVRYDHIR